MSDDFEGKSGDEVIPHQEDLENSLMDALEEDPRFCSGTTESESDNVLDFVQMSGLAGSSEAGPAGDTMSFDRDFESPSLEQVSFFEEGVGDVDSSMDPMLPITPDLDAPGGDAYDKEFEIPESDSVLGLKEIISELREEASTPAEEAGRSNALDSLAALAHSAEVSSYSQALAPTASLTVDASGVTVADDPRQLYLGTVESENISKGAPEGGPDDEDPTSHISTFGELAEARTLLDRLDISEVIDVNQAPGLKADGRGTTSGSLPIDSDADFDLEKRHSAPRRSRQRRKRHMRRWFLRFILLAIIGVAGFGAYQFYDNQTQSPQVAYRAAEKLLNAGHHAQASNAFQAYTRRFPLDIRRSDAMFMAGYAMQLAPSSPGESARKSYDEALALLEHFIVEFPNHSKTARAETLMGVVYSRQERYAEAIGMLGDPERRLRDPGAYLTTLRTLGRAYAATSRMENAHSAFMRAAALEENISPDQDYVELGSLYQTLAERSATEEDERHYLERAIEQWNFALRVPGLLKSRKDDVKLLRDVVASKLEGDIAGLGEGGVDSLVPAANEL